MGEGSLNKSLTDRVEADLSVKYTDSLNLQPATEADLPATSRINVGGSISKNYTVFDLVLSIDFVTGEKPNSAVGGAGVNQEVLAQLKGSSAFKHGITASVTGGVATFLGGKTSINDPTGTTDAEGNPVMVETDVTGQAFLAKANLKIVPVDWGFGEFEFNTTNYSYSLAEPKGQEVFEQSNAEVKNSFRITVGVSKSF